MLWTPPTAPDLYYHRANFCGIHIPDAPVVPGSNANNPACVMSCLLDNYPREIQDRYLATYAGYGYTHLQRSIGHSLNYGGTIDTHIELSMRAKRMGLFADEWILGGEALNTPNQDLSFWKPILDPILDALIAAHAIDTACVSWQMDQLFGSVPGNITIEIIQYVAEKLSGDIPLYTHWMNEALAWWKTGGELWSDDYVHDFDVHDRFTWWLAMQPYLTGGHHQGNTTQARTDPGLYQAKMRDTLNPFSDGRMGQSQRGGRVRHFNLTVYECTAQDQFGTDGQTEGFCTEDEGDLIGYLLACNVSDTGNGVIGGYGNGARRPDGSPL